ncbi:hypothetical protein EIP91_008026 [Steccherinum ochraceum]|uniref:AB hydrolase-1 domain-containing protein n=1 Tax=Steccherinum ochraceum TaxID=92696 RepID=A0A4V2MVB5_9APHY|nr:hypothetical protein EIP91_008026 [Steccherinum ochraceum]
MSDTPSERLGVFAVAHESEAPPTDDYLTLVMVHGYAWHAGIFKRLLPFASKHNTRIVLINRRDYPGSEPFTTDDLAKLNLVEGLREFMKDRAKEVYVLLMESIKTGRVSPKGGIVLGAWSWGTQFTTALLAHAASLPAENGIDVVSNIRFVVHLGALHTSKKLLSSTDSTLSDMPSHFMGYPPKKEFWMPLFDMSLDPNERVRLFARWVTGHFMHGETADEIVPSDYSADIPPTLDTMTPEDLESTLCIAPGAPGASDDVLVRVIMQTGVCVDLKRAAFFDIDPSSDWAKVKLRMIFADRSTWAEFWAAEGMRLEIEKAEKEGKPHRDIEIVRFRNVNHYACWDHPERTLVMLLGKGSSDNYV